MLQKLLAERQDPMEKNFKDAVGKSRGEVMRDVAEFLSTPFVINREKQIDLCTLVPELNMWEQFSFGLLAEAREQGWSEEETEQFYRRACAPVIGEETVSRMLEIFRQPKSEAYRSMEQKYGNEFTLLDGSYWATVLALGVDADQLGESMQYLRLYTVTLMEVAFMENRNPKSTYTWGYYESFRQMLDDLIAEPEAEPLPLKVRAIGGTAGKRVGNAYQLSLGVDLENPDPKQTAQSIDLDIVLKDKNGEVIATIKDRLNEIPPAGIFHYGVTRRICGNATASLSATVKAASYAVIKKAPPKLTLCAAKLGKEEASTRLGGSLRLETEKPLSALALHYQFLSAENKIIGGGCEWIYEGLEGTGELSLSSTIPVRINGATKVVYSADFDRS